MKFGTLTSNFYSSDIESCERLGGRQSVVAAVTVGESEFWVLILEEGKGEF